MVVDHLEYFNFRVACCVYDIIFFLKPITGLNECGNPYGMIGGYCQYSTHSHCTTQMISYS